MCIKIRDINLENFEILFDELYNNKDLNIKDFLLKKPVVSYKINLTLKYIINYFFSDVNITYYTNSMTRIYGSSVSINTMDKIWYNNCYGFQLKFSYSYNLYDLLKSNKTSFNIKEAEDIFIFLYENNEYFFYKNKNSRAMMKIILNCFITSIFNKKLCIRLTNHEYIFENHLLYNTIFLKEIIENYKDIIIFVDIDFIIFKELNDSIIDTFNNYKRPYYIKNITKYYHHKYRSNAVYYDDGTYSIYGFKKSDILLYNKLNHIGLNHQRKTKAIKLLNLNS